jgi:formate dehydrogenase subunit delta
MSGHDSLVRMANQIGAFFESMPDRDEALEGIAIHLRKFWTPKMRRTLLEQMDAGEHVQVSPIVRSAVQAHRAAL